MNRNLGILVVVLLLTASGIIAMLTYERNATTGRLRQSQAVQHKLEAELESLRTERDTLRKQLQKQNQAVAEASLAAAAANPPAAAPASSATSAGSNGPGRGKQGEITPDTVNKSRGAFAEMFKNPAMKEMMKQQQIAGLEMQYGGLFPKFNFSDEEKADFKQLITNKLQGEAEFGFKMLEDLTPQQRTDQAKAYEEFRNSSDAQIRDFLNSDADYNTYKAWEDTKTERMQLEMGRSLFTNSGEPLTPQQEEQLVSTMQQVRKQPSDVPDMSKPQNFDPSKLTQADIDKQLAHYDITADAVAAQAAQFLSPKQLDTLRTMQQQWRTMAESGLKMSAAMFGSQSGK
jgi:cell division protein FtsL